ncbi:prokaryotic cytochrome b561 family protein, partial [Yersinia pestis PY-19]
MASPI